MVDRTWSECGAARGRAPCGRASRPRLVPTSSAAALGEPGPFERHEGSRSSGLVLASGCPPMSTPTIRRSNSQGHPHALKHPSEFHRSTIPSLMKSLRFGGLRDYAAIRVVCFFSGSGGDRRRPCHRHRLLVSERGLDKNLNNRDVVAIVAARITLAGTVIGAFTSQPMTMDLSESIAIAS